VRLTLGRAPLEGDSSPRAWYDSMQARAIVKARRASTPETSGAWPVRTASTKLANSA
jgi:hypothetical protein